MLERFYTPDSLARPTVELTGSEAHHLLHVKRRSVSDEVELFDGRGTAVVAAITGLSRHSVELSVRRREESAGESGRVVDLAAAVPKSDRFRWLVEKATELGVARLLPLRTARSVVHPGGGKLEKMRQTVIAACKQSGRNRLMPIEPTTSWNELIEREFPGRRVLLAEPSGRPIGQLLPDAALDRPLLLVVGPEGGLTAGEIEQAAAAGAEPVSLGRQILRIETAAAALVAVCRLTGQ